MHLQRIQVPDFRVLKDVDITFEKEFVPSIFPLGSLNGGGKSTLLQLIFVLLHCSRDSDRIVFLKNMLEGFKIYQGFNKRMLAIVDIWDGDKNVIIEFFSYKDSYIRDLLSQNVKIEPTDNDYNNLDFSALDATKYLENEISKKEAIVSEIENIIKNLRSITRVADYQNQDSLLSEEIIKLRALGVNIVRKRANARYSFEEIEQKVKQELQKSQREIEQFKSDHKILELQSQEIFKYLQSQGITYLFSYSVNKNENDKEVLLCKIDNVEVVEAESFLNELSRKVFLTAPATQVFLFIYKEYRKLLFKDPRNESDDESSKTYYSEVQTAKAKLPGFFTYDFLPVDLLIEYFKSARDIDFREAIETGGEYGKTYKKLMQELNLLLVNKKINPNPDLSGVNFKIDRDGESTEVYPEDLSHGELKRLNIYLWLKYHNIQNSIVLMDEVEIAFHPDWQYQIISDLQQWAPSNQYILATHSYELCQALTPSHVKELEPKLIKKQEA